MIDVVALRQRLIEVHRADDGSNIGHRQIDHGLAQIVDLIGGLGSIERLIEDHGVDSDARIIFGDDFLPRNIEHLLHHVHAPANAFDEGRDEMKSGGKRALEAAKALQGVDVTLWHGEARLYQEDDDRYDDDDGQYAD